MLSKHTAHYSHFQDKIESCIQGMLCSDDQIAVQLLGNKHDFKKTRAVRLLSIMLMQNVSLTHSSGSYASFNVAEIQRDFSRLTAPEKL